MIKSFGTVLNDHPEVFKTSSSLKSDYKIDIVPPDVFRGDFVWNPLLSAIVYQGSCGNCWAVATVGVLADRFNILTNGQDFYSFSSYELTICESVITSKPSYNPDVLSQRNLSVHSTKACYGNTIISALKHIYIYGVVPYDCFTQSIQVEKGILDLQTYEKVSELPTCNQVLGIDYDTCADGDKAARFFRAINYYMLPADVMEIKKEIYKFGPVVAGFQLYDDFMDDYDGKSIYMGPSKQSKSIGGHAVRVVGWGKEGDIEYWIIANSWGKLWGNMGYFKMKMNIPECQLEANVYSLIPDIPTFNLQELNIPVNVDYDTMLERSNIFIDNRTGYKMSAIKKIIDGKLKSNFKELYNIEMLPDYKTFVAGSTLRYNIEYGDVISPYFKGLLEEKKDINYQLILIYSFLFIIAAIISYIFFNKIKRRR